MKITNLGNGLISIDTPYNPEFVSRVKQAGGRWNPSTKAWEADERSIETMRGIMRDIYGRDDTPHELVNIRVIVGEDSISEYCAPVILFGKTIAAARGRDSGARVGDGICFKSGRAVSGGSAKNWSTIIPEGSEFIIYDVPKLAVEQKIGWNDNYGTFEIIEPENPTSALKAEREALLKRLAEIDEILNAE